MAEEKTEEATHQKLKEAKKKGQVFKSQDVLALGSNIVLLLMITILFGNVVMSSGYYMHWVLSNIAELSNKSLIAPVSFAFDTYLESFLPVSILVILVTVVFTCVQTGFIFTFEPLRINFSKMNPVKGFKKLFSKKSMFEVVKSTARISVIFYVGYIEVESQLQYLSSEITLSIIENIVTLSSIVMNVVLLMIGCMIPFLLIDFLMQKRFFGQEMRMSKKEVKDEYKKQEGDPEIKSQRKKMQKELREKSNALSNVPNADIVVVNPIHIAVALKYDHKTMIAPKIIAKGKGPLANKIKQLAYENEVEMVEKIPLARALYKSSKINCEISPDFYDDVAELYRNLYQNN